ncbi:MAG: hypothetical protein QM778_03315 [Myxococcales bacterium]
MSIRERQPREQLEAAIHHLGDIAPEDLPPSTEASAARAKTFHGANAADPEARIAVAAVDLITSMGEDPRALRALSFIEWAWASRDNRRLLLTRQLARSASVVAAGSQDGHDAAEDLRGVLAILCSARLSLLGRTELANELRALADKRSVDVAVAAGLAAQVMAFRAADKRKAR